MPEEDLELVETPIEDVDNPAPSDLPAAVYEADESQKAGKSVSIQAGNRCKPYTFNGKNYGRIDLRATLANPTEAPAYAARIVHWYGKPFEPGSRILGYSGFAVRGGSAHWLASISARWTGYAPYASTHHIVYWWLHKNPEHNPPWAGDLTGAIHKTKGDRCFV